VPSGNRKEDAKAAKLIGNAVPPPMMTWILKNLKEVGLVKPVGVTKEIAREEECKCKDIRVDSNCRPANVENLGRKTTSTAEEDFALGSSVALRRAAEASAWLASSTRLQKRTVVGEESPKRGRSRRKGKRKRVLPPWAINPPRRAQSPLLPEWRVHCKRQGLPLKTREEELKAGMGDRRFLIELENLRGNRRLLIQQEDLVTKVWARIKSKAGPRVSIREKVTGGPKRCLEAWKESLGDKPDDKKLNWVKNFEFEFKEKCPPIPCKRNDPSCSDPAYAP
tara:strand:- start:1121 stop:1960 length:840 start_codon:yes stop_codon:yes gene_type:complete